MATLLLWLLPAGLGTATLALCSAEQRVPDPTGTLPARRLSLMLASAAAWISLGILALAGLYRFGLVRPALVALVLFGLFRLALSRDLGRYYQLNTTLGLATLIFTIAVLASTSTLRISP